MFIFAVRTLYYLILLRVMKVFWRLLITALLAVGLLSITSCNRDELDESIPHGIKSIHGKADFMALLPDGSVMFFKITSATACEVVAGPNGIMGNVKVPAEVSYEGNHYQVTCIANGAFNGCFGLVSVELPSCIKHIGERAFSGCERLNSVNIPAGITKVEYRAFYGCESLQEIKLPSSVRELENESFAGCKTLHSIAVPDSLVRMGNRCFADCHALTRINFPLTLVEIGSEAFANCYSITDPILPDGLKHIEPWLFKDCTTVKELRLPDSVTYIGNYTCKGCTSLTYVELPKSLLTVGRWSFTGCDNIKIVVVLAEEPPRIVSEAFTCYESAVLMVPVGSVDVYKNAPYWNQFKTIREYHASN